MQTVRTPGAPLPADRGASGPLPAASRAPATGLLRSRRARVTALAIVVIAAAIPWVIMDTIATGRVYLFSRQFLEELPQRLTGPGRFRFILQPVVAILLGVRGGLADARAGNPPYLFGLLFAAGRRRELLRSAAAAISTLLAMGIILDIVFQVVLYRQAHPGAALLVGPILVCAPYALSRGLTTRLARGLGGRKA